MLLPGAVKVVAHGAMQEKSVKLRHLPHQIPPVRKPTFYVLLLMVEVRGQICVYVRYTFMTCGFDNTHTRIRNPSYRLERSIRNGGFERKTKQFGQDTHKVSGVDGPSATQGNQDLVNL